MTLRT